MKTKTYRIVDDKRIEGVILHAIRHNVLYFFVEVIVYADGIIQCWEQFDLKRFTTYLKEEKILVAIPQNTEVHFHGLGKMNASNFIAEKSNEDFIKEIEDAISELNGNKGRVSLCVEGYKTYLEEGTIASFEKLRDLYDDLPAHQKRLFEISEYKDPLIRLMKDNVIEDEIVRKGHIEDYFDENLDD
jgi:hypothetical protein